MTTYLTISFPEWSPPDLSSLDFGSNCTHVRAFLQSWFDLSHYNDVGAMPGHGFNVTFWVPETVDATTTEAYFRDALPSNLQAIVSYGQILEWERLLRDNYTAAVNEFLRLKAQQNWTNTDSIPLDIPYYYTIIDAPSRACAQSVCGLGFDWNQLGDINGPGVFIYYVLLLVIGGVYSAIAILGAFRYRRRSEPKDQGPSQEPPRGSKSGDLFATAKTSFTGFSDTTAVFSLALPGAIFYRYMAGDVRGTARKDLIIELWILVYALCVCVWFYRVGAYIRRAQRAKDEAAHGGPARPNRKRSLATGFVLSFSVVAFIALVAFLALYQNSNVLSPFQFEQFWDGLCGYGGLVSKRDVIIAASLLAGYCALRLFILGWMVHLAVREDRNRLLRSRGYRTANNAERLRRMGMVRELERATKAAPWYRKWSDILGVVDVVVFAAGSTTIFVYYCKQRDQLSKIIGINPFKDGWSLGQILAVSGVLPNLVGFIHTYAGVLGEPGPHQEGH